MDDLISRQAAIEALDKIFPADPMRNDYTQGITCGAALATEYIKQLPSAERHEQITSEMDEIFRIASEIRLAVGCNTSRECWELARKGDIQRVRHGHWINVNGDGTAFRCSVCGEISCCNEAYCNECGAKMDEVEE